jgi:hypothetical protein
MPQPNNKSFKIIEAIIAKIGWDSPESIREVPQVTLYWRISTKSKDRAGHPSRTFQVPKD